MLVPKQYHVTLPGHRNWIIFPRLAAARTLSSDAEHHDDEHHDHPTWEAGPFSHLNISILTVLVCFVSSGTVLWTTQHQLKKHGFKR